MSNHGNIARLVLDEQVLESARDSALRVDCPFPTACADGRRCETSVGAALMLVDRKHAGRGAIDLAGIRTYFDGETSAVAEHLSGLSGLRFVAAHDPADRLQPGRLEQPIEASKSSLAESPAIDRDRGIDNNLRMSDVSRQHHVNTVA